MSKQESSTEKEEDIQRLVYLIYLYTKKSNFRKGEWLKDQALKALIYFGIVKGLFRTFDYAPLFVTWSDQTRFVNVSMEAEAILEKLVKDEILDRLRLSTEHYRYIFAYRVRDLSYIEKIPESIKEEVKRVYQCSKDLVLYEVKFNRYIEPILVCPRCDTKIELRVLKTEKMKFMSKIILLSSLMKEYIEV